MQSIEQMHSDIYSLYPSSIPAFLAIYTLAGDVGFGTSIRKVHERLYHLDRLGKPVFEEHQVLSNGTSDYIQIDHTKTFERSSGGKKGKCPARSYVRKILQPEINLAIQKIHALGYRADPDINRFNDILDSSKQRLDIFHPLRDQVTQRYLSITS